MKTLQKEITLAIAGILMFIGILMAMSEKGVGDPNYEISILDFVPNFIGAGLFALGALMCNNHYKKYGA